MPALLTGHKAPGTWRAATTSPASGDNALGVMATGTAGSGTTTLDSNDNSAIIINPH